MPVAPSPRRTGFSLIEVVLALGVVAVAVLALIGLLGSTFSSAREVALQHKAIDAITVLDGAMQTPRSIPNLTGASQNDSDFDRLYKSLRLNGRQYVDFIVMQKSQPGTVGSGAVATPAIPAVVCINQSNPALDTVLAGSGDYANSNPNTMMRLRVRLSSLLQGKLFKLNPATFEPLSTPWNMGTDLPATPDEYALAYLPLTVEVFPCDFTDATKPEVMENGTVTQPGIKPTLTQTVVINR